MRPDELERRLRERLDALGPAPRAELLHVLMLPDFERAEGIGEFYGSPKTRTFAELLIDAGETGRFGRWRSSGCCGKVLSLHQGPERTRARRRMVRSKRGLHRVGDGGEVEVALGRKATARHKQLRAVRRHAE